MAVPTAIVELEQRHSWLLPNRRVTSSNPLDRRILVNLPCQDISSQFGKHNFSKGLKSGASSTGRCNTQLRPTFIENKS